MIPPELQPLADSFHAHLEQCEQCRNNPFGLCPVGSGILIGFPVPSGLTEFIDQTETNQTNQSELK